MLPSSAQILAPSLSPILAMAQRTAALRAQGRDIVDLTLGEPDFLPPEHVIEAARKAAGGPLPYAPANGLRALRDAIRSSLLRDRGLTYAEDEISVGCGAKQVIFNAFLATLAPGDEVIIPAPYWASYPDMVRLCGGRPVIVPASGDNGFRLRASDLAAAITPRSRWVVVNAPGNPSGATYGTEDLQALAAVLDGHPGVRVLSDDIYAHIRFAPGPYVTLASVAPHLRARTLVVDGVSKAYAMTGWRVGWGCGPSDLIAAMTGVQAQNCTQTSTLSQHAAVAALEGPQGILAERCETYRCRRDAALTVLRAASRIRVEQPDGAFYLLPRIEGVIDDAALALLLLDAGVATVPGMAFGMPGHLRLSFATDETTLVEGCRRLVAAHEDPSFGVAS